MTKDEQINLLIQNALQEDIQDGDHSSLSTIDSNAQGKAILKIKQDGILAGMEVAEKIFRYMQPDIEFVALKKDGDAMKYGEIAFEVKARVHTILQCDRLVLNCTQRMSGIATLTHRHVEKLKGYHTRRLDTRKTTPNFRVLEKEAVRIGGAVNHRFGLYDMIMLKDNHIDYSEGIKNAIEKAYHYLQTNKLPLKVEVETRNLDEVKRVEAMGEEKVFRIMLDNFTPEQITEALPY